MSYSRILQCKGNLVKNPSFEQALAYWDIDNITITSYRPFEGAASAQLGSGTAKLSQDIPIGDDNKFPFLFGFAVQSPLSFDPGCLTAEVHWIDNKNVDIGTGVSLSVSSATTGEQLFWLTITDVTRVVPRHTQKARIIFTKAAGADSPNDVLNIDKVLLIKME